ncbi:hypothetical protein [Luteimonas deserti]|uniref:Alpha/beta hydrolase n=1 Tax=Luteimonas deserti TaxID=2752306 RepID=A0A7Z0TXL6_9GAMM|nr:hypothetical protein [Luteimonas deserti]NYZ61492.1 hypothetical protein [Luteimonas deserti]
MSPETAAPIRIAFLTGRSDRARCGLSPEQQRFLDALRAPGRQFVDCNFPYAAADAGHVAVPLPLAAWRNLGDYIGARRAAFAGRHRASVTARFEGDAAVVLLAGSCGLELLAGLQLPADLRTRLHVFAYGPVARRAPDVARLLCVQGRGDWISRLGWHGPVQRVGGGHMDYLRRPDVRALCDGFIAATPCAST